MTDREEEPYPHRDRVPLPDSRGYIPAVVRWVLALVVFAVVSVFALLLVTGDYINEGGVVLTVTQNHGLHQGDVFVLGGWAAAVLCEAALLASTRRRSG